VRILLANHTSAWSGAEVSLMRLVAGLRGEHELAIACPDEGRLAREVDAAGIERLSLPAVTASLKLHPVHTAAGLRQLGSAGNALAKAARRFQADVVHANTPRVGIMASVGMRAHDPPFVVRAHEHLPLSRVGRSIRGLILRKAAAVAAVSDFTATRFNEGLPEPVAVRVYNSIDQARFDRDRVVPAPIREELGIDPDAHLIGHVAQITSWKRQDVSIWARSRSWSTSSPSATRCTFSASAMTSRRSCVRWICRCFHRLRSRSVSLPWRAWRSARHRSYAPTAQGLSWSPTGKPVAYWPLQSQICGRTPPESCSPTGRRSTASASEGRPRPLASVTRSTRPRCWPSMSA
jgi:glycosyl transferase family 4